MNKRFWLLAASALSILACALGCANSKASLKKVRFATITVTGDYADIIQTAFREELLKRDVIFEADGDTLVIDAQWTYLTKDSAQEPPEVIIAGCTFIVNSRTFSATFPADRRTSYTLFIPNIHRTQIATKIAQTSAESIANSFAEQQRE